MTRFSLLALAGALAVSACDSTGPEPDPTPLNVRTASDVEADPVTSTGGGPPASTGRYTLFDLDTGTVVLSSAETDPAARAADSTSTVWDVGFRGTTIIVNGGTSGPGQGTAQVVAETFAAVTEAPATGYVADGANTTCPEVQTPGGPVPGSTLAVCTGSDAGWYNYAPAQNLISPIPGRTLVLTTGDGDYAKVRVLSYYRGNPNPPGASAPSRYYTFEYVVQPDGSRAFETTTGS